MARAKNTDVTVRDIMTKDPTTIGRNDTLDIAEHIMNLGRIRHMLVVDEENVVGVVSQRDLFHSALIRALGYGRKAQDAVMKTIRIKEVMSEPVITIAPDASVKEAARQMMEKKIGCLPVTNGGSLVGLVTETDILRYVVQL